MLETAGLNVPFKLLVIPTPDQFPPNGLYPVKLKGKEEIHVLSFNPELTLGNGLIVATTVSFFTQVPEPTV